MVENSNVCYLYLFVAAFFLVTDRFLKPWSPKKKKQLYTKIDFIMFNKREFIFISTFVMSLQDNYPHWVQGKLLIWFNIKFGYY